MNYLVPLRDRGFLILSYATPAFLSLNPTPLIIITYCTIFVDFGLANSMIGRVNEHIAFLLFRAFEMQGEVEEAFGYAVIYKALDPQVTFGLILCHMYRINSYPILSP